MGFVEISKLIFDDNGRNPSPEVIYENEQVDDYVSLLMELGLNTLGIEDINYCHFEQLTIENSEIGTVFPVIEGDYFEGGISPAFALYFVKISNCTNEGFDFEIYGRYDENDEFCILFKRDNAKYTSSNTAEYQGEEGNLEFQWENQGYLSITGFSQWIPEDNILCNTEYVGVS